MPSAGRNGRAWGATATVTSAAIWPLLVSTTVSEKGSRPATAGVSIPTWSRGALTVILSETLSDPILAARRVRPGMAGAAVVTVKGVVPPAGTLKGPAA